MKSKFASGENPYMLDNVLTICKSRRALELLWMGRHCSPCLQIKYLKFFTAS